jgi:mono/diheme cytochrome c family protein
LMLVGIPLGIIGLKREKPILAWLSLLLFVYLYGVAESKSLTFRASHNFEVAEQAAEDQPSEEEVVETILQQQQATLVEGGKVIYTTLCVQCHGEDGNKGLFKAPMLSQSAMTQDEIKNIVKNGRRNMPANKALTDAELDRVALYVQSLRD